MEVERTHHHNRNGLEAWIERTPPYDCILGMCANPDCPGGEQLGMRSHGRGTAKYRWILRGEGLAVQWLWYSDEHLPETVERMVLEHGPRWNYGRSGIPLYPMGADLGYHAATPTYEGHEPMDACDLLGIPCFYDGSGLAADRGLKILANEGDEAVWEWLERFWYSTMEDIQQRARKASTP